mgnify:CR=1 FL=1|tara:strand:+ start:1213 stop:1419 length:207 start_codon:yes stop_codon:yes gene_type:complete
MPQETIKYTIRQDGNVTQEVFNVPGDACLNLTEDIEIKLGDLENRTYTVDYYQNKNIQEDVAFQHNQD